MVIITIIIQFLSCDLRLCLMKGHQSRLHLRPGLLGPLLGMGFPMDEGQRMRTVLTVLAPAGQFAGCSQKVEEG